ncbi:fungal-specific transcription factor domain-containing protein [Sporodiniella umbellata]|nr:fungal-specific transcription factor domain-containing protein [Sporodiniella umbellata]
MIPIAPAQNNLSSPKTVDIQKEKRRRSKRSCDFCRQKKTRCDGDMRHPCTKCRQFKMDCVYLTKQKKRGPTKGSYVEMLERRLKRMENLIQSASAQGSCNSNQGSPEVFNYNDEHEDDRDEVNSLGSEESVPQAQCPTHFQIPDELEVIEHQMNGLKIKDYQRTRYMGSSSGMHLVNIDILKNHAKLRFMHSPSWFIQKLNEEEDEHVIMKTKEISPPQEMEASGPNPDRIKLFEDIPMLDAELLDGLIEIFFKRFHASCPIINKIEFLEQYYYHNPSPPDKYLMCSIAFMASIISDNEDFADRLQEEEFMELKEQLKTKAYQIISVVHKRPFISTIQSFLMLSLYAEDEVSNEDEDMSHWLFSGIAIRLAQDMGLHLDCSNWQIPPQEIELRRRLWYACYIIDRWISAQLGRPLCIIDKEFDVKLPSDRELDTSTARTRCHNKPQPLLEAEYHLQQGTPLYYSFSRFVGVTEVLGQVLEALYSTKNKQSRKKDVIQTLENSLDNWRQIFANEILPAVADYSLLQIAYFTVLIFIYRPFIKETEDTELTVKALSICTNAANQILSAAEATDHRTLVNAPWSPSAYCVFQAAIIFLHNARGGNEHIKRQGQRNLDRCVRIYVNAPRLCRTRTVRVLIAVASSYRVTLKHLPCAGCLACQTREKIIEYNSLPEYDPETVTVTREHLPETEAYEPNPEGFDRQVNSTRPEDMYTMALCQDGFGTTVRDKIRMIQEHQKHWQQQPPPTDNQAPPPPPIGLDCPIDSSTFSNLFTNDHLLQNFDLSSLRSDVPLWDVPSAVTWNEWEGFMKSN